MAWLKEALVEFKTEFEAEIPIVPSRRMLRQITFLKGSFGPETAEQHMADWELGKRLQVEGHPVPFKAEYEHAAGYWHRVVRPMILASLYGHFDLDNIDTLIAEAKTTKEYYDELDRGE